jgi:MFS family permease
VAEGRFLRFWLADFLASFGDGIRLAAFPLLATELTHSPAIVAAVVAVQGLPWLLIGVGIGVMLDRWDLRKALAGAGVIQAILVATLAAAVMLGVASLPLLFVVALVTSVGSMLHLVSAQTALPHLVPEEDRDHANGRLQAGELMGSELLGPAAAGLLFGISAVLPFALNAGTSGVAVLLLLSLPSVFRSVPKEAGQDTVEKSLFGDLRDGLRWLLENPTMRGLTVAATVVFMVDAAWFAILVLYVTRTLHREPRVYGLVLAFGALGGIAASAFVGRLLQRTSPHRVLAGAVVTMAGAQLVLGLSSNLVFASVMIACGSGAFAAYNITAVGLRQRIVPLRLLGRVTSAYLTVGYVAAAFGAVIGGILASSVSIQTPMLAGVLPLVAVAIGLAWHGGRLGGGGPAFSTPSGI